MKQRAFAEFLGTAILLATVVGSGIMGERLATGNMAIALLANAIATGCILYVLIATLAPISGAHFNPIVSIYQGVADRQPWPEVWLYVIVQILGALAGVALAHAMFDLQLLQHGIKPRTGTGQWISEVVAAAGLLLTIRLGVRHAASQVAPLVALYITAAYWFTASTSFANPAVTIARAFTATFSGIRATDVGPFIAAQLVGLALALLIERVLTASATAATDETALR